MRILLALLILPLTVPVTAAAESSLFFDEPAPLEKVAKTEEEKPILQPVSPNHETKVETTPEGAVPAAEDQSVEAGICANCKIPLPTWRPDYVPKDKIAGLDEPKVEGKPAPANVEPQTSSSLTQCLSRELAKTAQANVKNNYPWKGSKGRCGSGVANHLFKAGMSSSTSIGDAISFHTGKLLEQRGFKNIKTSKMNSENAPAGAVLVFRGPGTDMTKFGGGLPRFNRRKGRTAGYWVGHVTIKGDKPNRYYTDGWTSAPAIARRTLVAVYVPVKCDKRCRQKNQKACGAFF